MWGDNHRTKTLEECGQKCLEWKPKPPSMYACNIFVFCALEKCYAPAALPPGAMTGQCWLKHQPDPNKPQVNMKGRWSKSRPAWLSCRLMLALLLPRAQPWRWRHFGCQKCRFQPPGKATTPTRTSNATLARRHQCSGRQA